MDLGDFLDGLETGASVSLDGVCMTVVSIDSGLVTFDAISETLDRTTLSDRSEGDLLNVERSIRLGDELGGHILSGHVMGTAEIIDSRTVGEGLELLISIPDGCSPFILEKGFIAVDGMSLTVGKCGHIFETIIEAGSDHNLKLCGMHMMDSCRIEKAYRHFGHDITCEDHVLEAGLGFAVDTDKANFIGKKAVIDKRERAEKYKMIKQMRGKPNFDDLEKDLEYIDAKNIDVDEIKLCTDLTCGNKVMCFEHEGKIWKEGRKSMYYNRDYCVLDECKELFGLEKIGMKRVLSNFRLERSDRSKKSWVDNWKKVSWGPCVGDNKGSKNNVVYCVMDKVEPGEEIGKHKKRMLADRKLLKEFAKIGVFRGIFRVSDFNGRNVLTKGEDKLVSIDEGDIGKRLDIIGGREKWLIGALNKDKTIINEILNELTYDHTKIIMSLEMMEQYKFGFELINEVENNWKNLKVDLESEGIEFE